MALAAQEGQRCSKTWPLYNSSKSTQLAFKGDTLVGRNFKAKAKNYNEFLTTTEPKIENHKICPYMSIYGYIEKQKKDLYIYIYI
jgi:hypothetical protein